MMYRRRTDSTGRPHARSPFPQWTQSANTSCLAALKGAALHWQLHPPPAQPSPSPPPPLPPHPLPLPHLRNHLRHPRPLHLDRHLHTRLPARHLRPQHAAVHLRARMRGRA